MNTAKLYVPSSPVVVGITFVPHPWPLVVVAIGGILTFVPHSSLLVVVIAVAVPPPPPPS